MISKEDKDKAYAKLTIGELKSLRDINKELGVFIERHEEITIEGLHNLNSIQKSLDIIKDLYLIKVISLLKHGDELD